MSSASTLHLALLRPSVIQILRAAGFHAANPAVLDVLTDLCARYLLLVASRTADQLCSRTLLDDCSHQELELLSPTISDVRLGLTSSAAFSSTMTPSEEAWCESLRRPLSSFPTRARDKERRRRDEQDTRDVCELLDWAAGPSAHEERRIVGAVDKDPSRLFRGPEALPSDFLEKGKASPKEDYVTALKKKHSKTADSTRYAGTALGRPADSRGRLVIEGGPSSLHAWEISRGRKTSDSP